MPSSLVYFALEVPTTPLAAPVPCQETRRLGCNEVYLRTGQHGLRLVKRQADLLELVIALVEAGNHVVAEHGFIIADDPELDLNSHGHSEGSMADKLQPTCLPPRWPRHPTDFYALLRDADHRIRFHFTPKHASWLNQIELWFSILARKVLRRGSFTSTEDLKDKIDRFITYFNETLAKPFRWTMRGKPLTI